MEIKLTPQQRKTLRESGLFTYFEEEGELRQGEEVVVIGGKEVTLKDRPFRVIAVQSVANSAMTAFTISNGTFKLSDPTNIAQLM
ncbi:MAG: hypothetical protein WCK91_02855, partial [bacterium]